MKIQLGSDACWKLQIGEKKRVHINLFAVFSIFGWSLVGSFGGKSAQCFHVYNQYLSLFNRKEYFNTGAAISYLDDMGLRENENQNDKSAIEQFENDLQFFNGRFVTSLLWKSNHVNLSNNLENAK